METGSNSESVKRAEPRSVRGGAGNRHGHVAGNVEPFKPRTEHNPRELRSWAKRTGFVSDYSGEVGTSASEKFESFERRGAGSSPKIEIDPVLGRTRHDRGNEIEPALHGGGMRTENGTVLDGATVRRGREEEEENEPILGLNHDGGRKGGFRGHENGNANGMVNRDSNGHGHGVSAVTPVPEEKNEEEGGGQGEVKVNLYPEGEEPADGELKGPSRLKCGLKENPGFG